jgi:hypothetical protein
MITSPPVRVRVTRKPADPLAEVAVGRTYLVLVDEDGRAVVAGAAVASRLEPDEYEFTRWRVRHSDDPGYQGDGWRWSLSLRLPGIRLPHRNRLRPSSAAETLVVMQIQRELGVDAPFTLDMVPLTSDQRAAVLTEWLATQRFYANARGQEGEILGAELRPGDVLFIDNAWLVLGREMPHELTGYDSTRRRRFQSPQWDPGRLEVVRDQVYSYRRTGTG